MLWYWRIGKILYMLWLLKEITCLIFKIFKYSYVIWCLLCFRCGSPVSFVIFLTILFLKLQALLTNCDVFCVLFCFLPAVFYDQVHKYQHTCVQLQWTNCTYIYMFVIHFVLTRQHIVYTYTHTHTHTLYG